MTGAVAIAVAQCDVLVNGCYSFCYGLHFSCYGWRFDVLADMAFVSLVMDGKMALSPLLLLPQRLLLLLLCMSLLL